MTGFAEDFKNIGLGTGMTPGGQTSDMNGFGMASGMLRDPSSYNFNSSIDPNTFGGAPDLGDKSMDLKTKFSLGLGIAQTGMNAYLGFQQNKLAKQQFKDSRYQFETNLGMQKNVMAGNATQQYRTAANPEMLASSEAAHLASFGLKPATVA